MANSLIVSNTLLQRDVVFVDEKLKLKPPLTKMNHFR